MKENHFLDVGCEVCGHRPQSERHLCEEEWEESLKHTLMAYHVSGEGMKAITNHVRKILAVECTKSYENGYNDGARETREKVYGDLHTMFVNTSGFKEKCVKLSDYLSVITPTKTE